MAALIDFPDVTDAERHFTRTDIANFLNDNPDSLKKFMFETSRQLVTVDFDVLDWVTIDKTRSQYELSTYEAEVARDAVSALSSRADLSQYDKVVLFIVPGEFGFPGCVAWLSPIRYRTPNGVFELGTAVLSGYDMGCVRKGRIAHEFGHTYGFLHSYQIHCQKQPGIPRNLIDVTDKNDSCYDLSCVTSDCSETVVEDSGVVANSDFDMMGGDQTNRYEEYFPVHFQAVWQAMAGWLPEEQVLIASQAGEYTLTNLEALTSSAKAIKIPVGADHEEETQYYWLETRTFTPACEVNIRQHAREISVNVGSYNTFNYGWIVRPDLPFWDPHRGIRVEMLGCTQGADEETVRLKIDFTRLTADKPLVALFDGGETSVNLTNNSNALVEIGAVSIGGRHPTNFIINSDECSNRALNPGKSCAIDVWHISEYPTRGNIRDADSAKHGVLKIPNSDALAADLAIALFGNQSKRDTRTSTHTPTPTTVTGGQEPISPTPTHTPTVTPVTGGNTQSRLSELERQMGMVQQLLQNLQSLIQALTNRVTALEGGTAPVVTPPPTPTPTATPSPTPTSVSEPDPVPTAVDGDACMQSIEPGTISGTWTRRCGSVNSPGGETYYAKFYTFSLDAAAEVVITLSADESTYLYLLSGARNYGNVEQEAGADNTPTTTLTKTLEAGIYTIEATTYYPNVIGDFTLDLRLRR